MAARKKKSTPASPKRKENPAAVPVAMPTAEPGKKKVLHIGCGVANPAKLHVTFRTPEWHEIRMDIDPDVKPDIVADMIHMPMIEDGSMDAVWSSHNVEHLYAHQVPLALGEFYRVLKETGFALITLPDIRAVAERIAQGKLEETLYQSPAGPIAALDVLYGFGKAIAQGNHFMAHKTAFIAETLGLKLKAAGFCNIQVKRDNFDLWAVAHKLPADHPKRIDKIVIMGQQPPATATTQAGLSDELDRPPVARQKSEFV